MKKLLVTFLLILSSYSFSQAYPHITELRGLEDSLTQTHLFYRYFFPGAGDCWSKSIYHINVNIGSDTLFIYDAASDPIGEGCRGQFVHDYDFFETDYAKFIYGGYDYFYDPVPILVRYDGEVQLPLSGFGGVTEIEISKINENLVYVVWNSALFQSTDGGYNFTINLDSLAQLDNPMISLSKNNDNQIYGINDNKLVRSEDEGYSYIIVDNSEWNNNSYLFYDQDGSHIYGLSVSYSFLTQSYNSKIYISNDNGNPFTWNNILEYQGKIWFALDENQSGEIYYSAGNWIFKSTDFGNSFLTYKQLDRNITGLYKKSGTNILYASTPLKIYEITPDTIQAIKSLPIPASAFKYYPLKAGHRWVYDNYTHIEWNNYHTIFIREVVSDSLLPNGKRYFRMDEYEYSSPFINTTFERIDSVNGFVYRYYEDPGLPDDEYLIDDLLAEVGDTVWSSREFYDPYFPTIVIEQNTFNKWNLEKPRITYQHQGLGIYTHSLTQDIGLDSIGFNFDFGNTEVIIKGCIINGIVYGDTSVVSVEDEEKPIATSFKLEQNYPNPFNPTTKIKYIIPASLNPSKGGTLVQLKVYDVLGNEITALVNEELSAGEYEVEFSPETSIKQPASGIYFYQLRAGEFIQTKKMVYLK
jgi:hypothetical protein